MKKLIILVIPALVFMLAGCSIGLETQKQDKTSTEQETQQDEQPAATQEEDLPTSSDASSKQQIEFNREIKKQKGKVYDTSDDYIRGIMKKDPSKLNPKELAIYNGVTKQIDSKSELSEADEAIRADQRAMSEKRNAKSPYEQARIDEAMKKKEEQESGNEKNRYLPHGHFEEFQKIQNETERELSQGELDDEYRRRNQLPQHQEPQQEQAKQQEQQQLQQAPTEQPTQQVPTERDTTKQAEQKHETVEAEKEVRKTEEN